MSKFSPKVRALLVISFIRLSVFVSSFISSYWFKACWTQMEKGDVMHFWPIRFLQHLNQNLITVDGQLNVWYYRGMHNFFQVFKREKIFFFCYKDTFLSYVIYSHHYQILNCSVLTRNFCPIIYFLWSHHKMLLLLHKLNIIKTNFSHYNINWIRLMLYVMLRMRHWKSIIYSLIINLYLPI